MCQCVPRKASPQQSKPQDRELYVFGYCQRRLAYLVQDKKLFREIEKVGYKDLTSKFAVFYDKTKLGRLLRFYEGDEGRDRFVFPDGLDEFEVQADKLECPLLGVKRTWRGLCQRCPLLTHSGHSSRLRALKQPMEFLGWHNPTRERCWTKIVPVQAWEVNPLMPCNHYTNVFFCHTLNALPTTSSCLSSLNENLSKEIGMRTIVLARCALTCLESAAQAQVASYYGKELAGDERHRGKGSTRCHDRCAPDASVWDPGSSYEYPQRPVGNSADQ